MRRLLPALLCLLVSLPVHAWNAAGHRLVAVIAWQQLSPAARDAITTHLAHHPDHARWADQARSADPIALFAEAATWPDDIRHDPRFHDEERDPPTPALPGIPDMARHKRWHYLDLDADGRVRAGELDSRIAHLIRQLKASPPPGQIAYALPWLLHLVGDIHQPLHVGRHGDEGGNAVEIENPFNKRQPFSSLHRYWDDLPGPPWLRGKRLEDNARRLLARYPAPEQGDVARWREESHRLLDSAYPTEPGSLLPVVSETFCRASRDTANRRIVEAGYRLGRLLERIFGQAVSRETP